ncbi:hypothetical protein BGZ92_010895 [Podila epicladia]|nr:hypothetical protein BGZ92_010895 [Podila epicladia]
MIVRRTRLDSQYIKNAELETAQSLRQDRVLQNMQRVKLAGVAQRDREGVALLEKQDAVKKQYESLRVNIKSETPRVLHRDIDPLTLTSSSVNADAVASASASMEGYHVELFENESKRHTPVSPTNTVTDALSSGQNDPISNVSSLSNTAGTSSELSTAGRSDFRILSITDVLTEHSLMVDRTVGNKRYWATTDDDAIKRLKAESEDIRSAFSALSSSGSSTRPPLGNNPASPP